MARWAKSALIVAAVAVFGCGSDEDSSEDRDPDRALLGGDTTVFDTSQNAFGYAARNASDEHRDRFFVGNSFFKQNWVTAPASTEARDGLGPLFNARSCSSCHLNDGRGRPPLDADEPIVGLLFRLSTPEGGAEPSYGGQLQPYAILGVQPEGLPRIEYEEVAGSYDDGTSYTLLRPSYAFDELAYGPMVDGVLVSPRVAPQMVGLGLLEAVPEQTLLALADPDDADLDGISGRANYVKSAKSGESTFGRFGWKSNQPSLEEQIAGAFLGDMGITTNIHPAQDCSTAESACTAAIAGGAPELDDARLADVVLYSALLAVPARRDIDDASALAGEKTFDKIGCGGCHVARLETSNSFLPELANQTIWPYTDLLLHDLGSELADERPDGEASGSEWRTPPLWGLGLIHTVNGHTRLLHDGRARSVEEAILWHGGEAESARDAFRALSSSERASLLRFLETL